MHGSKNFAAAAGGEGCRPKKITPTPQHRGDFCGVILVVISCSTYPARNAQVAEGLLQACCLAVIKPISGCVRISCFGLMITSLLQVVNRLDAS